MPSGEIMNKCVASLKQDKHCLVCEFVVVKEHIPQRVSEIHMCRNVSWDGNEELCLKNSKYSHGRGTSSVVACTFHAVPGRRCPGCTTTSGTIQARALRGRTASREA